MSSAVSRASSQLTNLGDLSDFADVLSSTSLQDLPDLSGVADVLSRKEISPFSSPSSFFSSLALVVGTVSFGLAVVSLLEGDSPETILSESVFVASRIAATYTLIYGIVLLD